MVTGLQKLIKVVLASGHHQIVQFKIFTILWASAFDNIQPVFSASGGELGEEMVLGLRTGQRES
jgi:hypothetical protein